MRLLADAFYFSEGAGASLCCVSTTLPCQRSWRRSLERELLLSFILEANVVGS